MTRVTLKGWASRGQHPSESCLPEHLYYSSSFESVKFIKLVHDSDYKLAESKRAIESVKNGRDFVVEFTLPNLAKEFENRTREQENKRTREQENKRIWDSG